MTDSQQLELAVPTHHNQHLFSDHYLDEILPNRPQWQGLRSHAQQVMEQIAGLFEKFVPSDKEAQTEDDLVKPVLKLLGHIFEVQASLKTSDGTKTPDYIFYSDADSLNAHKKQKVLTDALPNEGGIAVGDAKYWMRPLDIAIKQKSADALSNKNPSYQIYFYMHQSGVTWGILTNGKQWRLYHKETAHKHDHFYEVDLQELVESGDVDRFLYFFAFFRREAFDDGPLSIAAILRESADYAHNVGNSLKDQVYDALRHIAQGFLDYEPNKLGSDPNTLKTIYDNSLILLYRLIFVLYAESRDLLPVRENQQYRDTYSLHAIKQSVARDLKSGRAFLSGSALLWPRLLQLFHDIDQGNEPLTIATFNGGLFDPKKHEFLAKYTVGDAHLQQAIDKLARVGGEFVDYRDLSVRHMGTIYEGLLEYRLQPLPEPEEGWAVELVNDKGERKATGSYYTPDYIVKYIVEQTVGPVLTGAVEGKESDKDKMNAVLGVNVLDPAMGSGHFLVEATEYIARFLVDLAITPDTRTQEEADVAFWKRRVVQSCVYGVDLNPLAVELAKLSLWLITVAKDRPLSFLDHHLRPGNSLVGARLEHLDVAPTVKRKKKDKVSELQTSLFTDSDFTQRMSTAIGFMQFIESHDATDVDGVKAQEKAYDELRKQLADKYSHFANLVTAAHFGLVLDAKQLPQVVAYAKGNNIGGLKAIERIVIEADDIAKRERFFHWELEFPEVYFDEYGRPLGIYAGFDAVVGNPPYVRQEQLAQYKLYFEKHFPDVYHGVADLYAYFLAQGVQQLGLHGRLSYITSGTFQKLDSGAPLRAYLSENTTLLQLVDFGDQQVFAGALTYPIILILEKVLPEFRGTFEYCSPDVLDGRKDDVLRLALPYSDTPWVFVKQGLAHVLHGWDSSVPLEMYLGDQEVCRGVTTGCNDAFVISADERAELIRKDARSAELLKPIVHGEHIHPWYHADSKLWLIFTRRGVDIEAYPALRDYLMRYRHRLEPKPLDWDDAKPWAGRKSGNYKWFEIQDTVAYYPAFEQLRIHSTKVSLYPSFCISEDMLYAGNTSYVIPVRDRNAAYYLVGLLNSHVAEFYYRSVFTPKANGYYEVQPGRLNEFPVPLFALPGENNVAELAELLTAMAQDRYALHCRVRHRIQSDLGTQGKKLNNKLTAWWGQDFNGLRDEIKKVFKTDIPVNERDQWETWFADQRAEHVRLTNEIIRLETELNECVYKLFDLTPDEIKLIEESTKYKYGEV